VNVFLSRLTGDPIGFTVIGIFVIDKNTILTVRTTYMYKLIPVCSMSVFEAGYSSCLSQ